MTPPIDPLLVGLLQECGYVIDSSGATVRLMGDSQTQTVCREEDGLITVETIERGSSNGVDLVTSDVLVFQIYIALQVGGDWRDLHGLRWLTNDLLAPLVEMTLVEESESTWGVRRLDGVVIGHRLVRSRAEKLATALSFPLDVVVAALKDPTGSPIWTRSA